jgi:hypothetical protein
MFAAVSRTLQAPTLFLQATRSAQRLASSGGSKPPGNWPGAEFGLPDPYRPDFRNAPQAETDHYFEFDPTQTYQGEKEVPLQWILSDEGMGPDIDPDVNPYYALAMLTGALTVMGGVALLAMSMATEPPIAPRRFDDEIMAVSYGYRDPARSE